MSYKFAVFSTDGGGLVRRNGTTFVFVETSKNPFDEPKKIGDVMPDGWLICPENKLAEQDVVEHPEDFRSVLV